MMRDGYKQTEVGVIPDDWGIKCLKDDILLLSGHHVLSQYCNTHGEGFPYLTGPADFPNGKIKQTKFTNKPTTVCSENDLLITVKGSGSGSMIQADGAYCISRQLMAIRVQGWESKFVSYSLLQNASRIREASTGLIPGLSRSDILEQRIPIPKTKKEQKAIAQALSDVDELIASLEKLMAKKRDIKTATMQQLLTGKKRLPGYGEGKGYKQTELGEIPEDWEVTRFGSIVDYVSSGKTSTKQNGGNIPLYGSTGLIGFSWQGEYKGKALLVARVGANAGSLNIVDGVYGVSDNTIIVKIDNKHDINFYEYQLIIKRLNRLVFGSGQPLITGTQLKELFIVEPSYKEQKAIAQVLSDIDSDLSTIESKLQKTKSLKQGMMQELLTGKTRLL